MISRIVVAVAIGILTALLILLLGVVCIALHVPVLKDVGAFLEQWCWVFGVLAGVLAFFGGWNPFQRA